MKTLALRLGRSQRLRTPAEFRRVYQSRQFGRSSHHSFNVLAREQNNDEPFPSRLGVTVSKKVSKNAVVRNRLKRQIKEFYRHKQHQLESANLVITAQPSSAKISAAQYQESLEALWQKVLKWQRWHLSRESAEKGDGQGEKAQ